MAVRVHATDVFVAHTRPSPPRALIVLNSPFKLARLAELWKWANIRICADGGANYLCDHFADLLPDHIVGDLDSIRPAVREHYQAKGTNIVHNNEKNSNDLEKSLQFAWQLNGDCDIVVLSQGGGRFDQTIANLHAFYAHPEKKLRFVMDNSLVYLLTPGEHEVRVDGRVEGPTCGLLPVANACKSVTTSGLRWNLNEQTLQMGGLISSSNEATADVVRVTTSDPLLWSIELKT